MEISHERVKQHGTQSNIHFT